MRAEFFYDVTDLQEIYNLKARTADKDVRLNWREFDEIARRAIRDAEREENAEPLP